MKLKDYTLAGWEGRKIKRQKVLGNIKVLLLSVKGVEREGLKNLIAIDTEENILWIADLPTELYDSYYDMKYEKGVIIARSSNSHISEIDHQTGNIIKKYMVK